MDLPHGAVDAPHAGAGTPFGAAKGSKTAYHALDEGTG